MIWDDVTGLTAVNVVGTFTLSNSYPGENVTNVAVQYFFCDGPSHFDFSRNELSGTGDGLSVENFCPNV